MEEFEYSEMFTLISTKIFKGLTPKISRSISKRAKQFAAAQKENKKVVENDPLKKMTLEEAIAYKSDYSKSMYEKYDSAKVESHWMDWWEKKKFFHLDAKEALSVPPEKRFLMNFPPPNITGVLHVGHALTSAVEDCMCRHRRMQGYKTMFLPGSDHAGIATQNVVERQLAADGLPDRKTMGRTEFLKKIWEWKEQKGNSIMNQMKKLGGSFDWDRVVFTLDEKRTVAVEEAFIRLYDND